MCAVLYGYNDGYSVAIDLQDAFRRSGVIDFGALARHLDVNGMLPETHELITNGYLVRTNGYKIPGKPGFRFVLEARCVSEIEYEHGFLSTGAEYQQRVDWGFNGASTNPERFQVLLQRLGAGWQALTQQVRIHEEVWEHLDVPD